VLSPYTSDVEVKSTRFPFFAAAEKTTSVACTLFSIVLIGLSITRRTPTSAARW